MSMGEGEYMEGFRELEWRGGEAVYLLQLIELAYNWNRKGRVLDVGIGAGRSFKTLGSLGFKNVVGVDHDAGSLEVARDRTEEKAVLASGQSLPFTDGTFEYVSVQNVFQDIGNRAELARLLSELVRVIKNGGEMIVVNPTPISYLVKTVEFDCQKYLLRNLASVVLGNGAEVMGEVMERLGQFHSVYLGENKTFIDHVWTKSDLEKVFRKTGLIVNRFLYAKLPENWKDLWWQSERLIPPAMLFLLKKSGV